MFSANYDDLTADPGVVFYYWAVAASNATGASASPFSSPAASGWAGSGPAFPSNFGGDLLLVR